MDEACITDQVDNSYMVAYAKIMIEKDTGISLLGVYFGGIGQTHDEAEQIARECVNSIKGKTILPKVIQVDANYTVIDALYDAHDRFEQMTEKMREADEIISRENKKR